MIGSMVRWRFAVTAIVLCVASTARCEPVDIGPPERQLSEGFVAAINGSPAARGEWIDRAIRMESASERDGWIENLDTLADSTGGISLASIERKGNNLRLWVKTTKLGLSRRIDLVPTEDASRVKNVIAVARPAPYSGRLIDESVAVGALTAAIRERVKFSADRDEFSGSVLVAKGTQTVHFEAVGAADKDFSIPNARDTRFHVGSMGKMFTAVAIAQLVDAGRLSFDQKLIEVLPKYANRAAAEKITIRQLLTHTAGLGGLFDRPRFDARKPFRTVTEELDVFAAEPLRFEPGTRASYSNEGFVVLGAVVEAVSGETFYDYVQKNIFDRAGMKGSAFYQIDRVGLKRAVGYRYAADDPLGLDARQPNWGFSSFVYRGDGAGGSYATVDDLVAFLNAFREGRLVKPDTAGQLLTPPAVGLNNYALGFMVTKVGNRRIVGHTGGGTGSGINCAASIVWETGYVYAVGGNYDAPFAQEVGADIGTMLAFQSSN